MYIPTPIEASIPQVWKEVMAQTHNWHLICDTIMNTQDNSLTLSEAEWEELEDRIKRLRYGLLDLYIFAIALCEGGPSDATIMKTFIDDKKVLKNAATSRGS